MNPSSLVDIYVKRDRNDAEGVKLTVSTVVGSAAGFGWNEYKFSPAAPLNNNEPFVNPIIQITFKVFSRGHIVNQNLTRTWRYDTCHEG